MAQINFIAIKRKDIFFGEALLERDSEHGFGVLAFESAFGRKVGVIDQLLCDRRTALTKIFVLRIAH